jgi:phage shock protein A
MSQGQQISVEAALEAFRREYGQAADANVLLKARVAELETELEQLRGASSPSPAPDPASTGPESTMQP